GPVAVMPPERFPADIRKEGGVARMADPSKIKEIQEAVTIPVMAKARIGHFVEAQILEALEVDYIDESEVLTPADTANHIDKWKFTVPFVCGCTNLGEALRRIAEGAAMIRTKGEAGTGDIVNAVTHMRSVFGAIKKLGAMSSDELYSGAEELRAREGDRRGDDALPGRGGLGASLSGSGRRNDGPLGSRHPARRAARDSRLVSRGAPLQPPPQHRVAP